MKFIVDEDLSPRVARYLCQEYYFDAIAVRDYLSARLLHLALACQRYGKHSATANEVCWVPQIQKYSRDFLLNCLIYLNLRHCLSL